MGRTDLEKAQGGTTAEATESENTVRAKLTPSSATRKRDVTDKASLASIRAIPSARMSGHVKLRYSVRTPEEVEGEISTTE